MPAPFRRRPVCQGISRLIDRSVPTVVMHLNAATRKLGAKNRTQAVAKARHFRLTRPAARAITAGQWRRATLSVVIAAAGPPPPA